MGKNTCIYVYVYDNIYLGGEFMEKKEIRKVRSANGSITVALPVQFREALGINKESEVEISLQDGKIIIEKK